MKAEGLEHERLGTRQARKDAKAAKGLEHEMRER